MKALFGESGGGAGLAAKTHIGRWREKLSREPLLLFLLIGALLLGADRLYGASTGADDTPRRIVVDRDAILNFFQYRSKVFSEQGAGQSFDAMPADERGRLIDDYVREEALYREALSWGLDRQDYVLRRRLVQSIEFALQEDPAGTVPDEAALRRFYQAHPQRYTVTPAISFDHVYFRPGPGAAARAKAARSAIQGGGTDPATLGDRFLYSSSYAGQSLDSVVRDFGQKFAAALFADRQTHGWIGPIESEHGIHLVHVTDSQGGGVQPFEQVRSRVAADVVEERRRQRREEAVKHIVDQYHVSVASGLR